MSPIRVPDYVGVIHQAQLTNELKRELLIFDKIAICNWGPPNECLPTMTADLEWLKEQGVLVDCGVASDEFFDNHDDEVMPLIISGIATVNSLKAIPLVDRSPEEDSLRQRLIQRYWHIQVRIAAIKLRTDGLDSVPALEMRDLPALGYSGNKKDTVLRIIINAFPEPDDLTDMDAILRFRQEDHSRRAFLRLRDWMSGVARGELDPREVEVKLASGLAEYEASLRDSGIETRNGILETLFVSGVEIAENLVKFKWSPLIKAGFDIFRDSKKFSEAARKAPGNQLAYVWTSNRRFGGKSPR